MNKYLYIIAAVLISFSSCSKNELQPAPSKPSEDVPTEFAEGELLVKFSPEMTDILDDVVAENAVATRSGIPSTDEVLSILGAYSLQRVFPVDARTEKKTREAGLHLWYRVRFDKNMDIDAAVTRLAALGEVSKIQKNPVIKRAYASDKKPIVVSDNARLSTKGVSSFPFNDKLLPNQWGYINNGNYDFDRNRDDNVHSIAGSDVNCQEAWKLCTGDPSIIVAVLDEGVMYTHPDLAGNMWVNEGETLNSGNDADGNGYKGDVYGYNFVRDNGDITFASNGDTGHGTHVAGTIAAVNGNGIGVCGIAGGDGTPDSGVKIMSCQIFDGATSATLWGEARAIKYAADNGAVILQCSWGYNSAKANPIYGYVPGLASEKEWEETYPLEKEAIDYFIHNAGSPNGAIDGGLAIFASGNEYAAQAAFPAAYSKCVSVSAIAADFTPASYSNYGAEINLSAPGGDGEYHGRKGVNDEDLGDEQQGQILSTLVSGSEAVYGYYEGTSMACPHVSGVAALGLSYAVKLHKHFKAEDFRKMLIDSGSDLDQYMTGKKAYNYNHTSAGSSISVMNLAEYKGKMGRLVNAGALLRQVADNANGSPMKLPNAYIATGQSWKITLSYYFDNGENLTFSAVSAFPEIASVSVSGKILTISGVKDGVTNVTVKSSDNKSQTIAVTVRTGAGNGGWM